MMGQETRKLVKPVRGQERGFPVFSGDRDCRYPLFILWESSSYKIKSLRRIVLYLFGKLQRMTEKEFYGT